MKEQFLTAIKENTVENEDLFNASRQLQQIINATGDGIWVIDFDYKVQRINDKVASMLGFHKKEAIGQKCYQLFDGDKCLTPECPLFRIQHGEHKAAIESEIECSDGRNITCAISAAPIKNEQGEITGIVEFLKDITEKKKIDERINYLAFHDQLTGLPNRTCFYDRLSVELAHAHRNKEMLAVLFIDLDGFKYVNDSMGHAIGDLLLKDVARRLGKSVRASDTVARIGGDEFTILLSGLKRPKDAAVLANKINKAFKEPWHVENVDFQIQASIGISLYPGDGDDPNALMDHADMAMYRAKKHTCKYQFYNYYMNQNCPKKIKLITTE